MTLSINLRPAAAVQGGPGIGLMTAAGNPWPVPDALAVDLVNRGLATPLNWPNTSQGTAVTATTDPLTGGISLSAGGSSLQIAQTYTWAQLQALTGVGAGTRLYCSDLGYAEFVYDGTRWAPRSPLALMSSGIPFVMPSSGNVTSTSGDITVNQTFGYTIGWCYAYFPTGQLNSVGAASSPGWYLTNFTSATVGKVYQYVYTTGVPVLPASPPAIVTAIAAYTQQTAVTLSGPQIQIPANLLGINGAIEFDATWGSAGTAGTTIGSAIGGNGYALAVGMGTSSSARTNTLVRNRGVANQQVAANIFTNASFGGNGGTNRYSTIDTTIAQPAAHQLQIGGASQWVICESYSITLRP